MNLPLDRRTSGLLLVAVAWALFLAAVGSPEILLFTAPVFLLAGPLALGRYVGEELVAGSRNVRQPERDRGVSVWGVRAVERRLIIGSMLIASNLAGRAPPTPAV